jgi:hypothetical protein
LDNNRPLISALVIRRDEYYEGDGFSKLANNLGFGDWKRLKRERIYEITQRKEIIEKWHDDSYYLKK